MRMQDENKEDSIERIYLREQSEADQYIQSMTLAISSIQNSVIIRWLILSANFQRFLCKKKIKEDIADMEKAINKEL